MSRSKSERVPQQSDAFVQFDREQRLIQRLGQLGSHVDMGVTDQAIRRERIREVILLKGLDVCICGRSVERKLLTFSEVFERVFGEPLITEAMRTAARKLRAGG